MIYKLSELINMSLYDNQYIKYRQSFHILYNKLNIMVMLLL
ncbi:hypothetical protein rpr22_0583 [Rickettsia prowazekii str. Rp22]|uniref:Uncharacterized protein n=1 Tax=Rickettsia prowazekii (strain Rp22) TaxID=449216 RepID=D5AXF2_RICPP|nr:hypothetical protein rpr22_0583 [Rickettsia prowazekii str. Rp22]